MRNTDLAKLRYYVSELRYWLPPPKPVIVVRRRGPDMGFSRDCGTHFRLVINPDYDWQMQMEVLCHEWAHILDEETPDIGDPHTNDWGVWYARVFRRMAYISKGLTYILET